MFQNNLEFKFIRKRRKHFEMRIDNEVEELPEFLKKRRKLCIEMNPLKLSIKKEFSIISPYLIIRDFPKSYKFSQLWTDKEKDLVKSFTEKENNDTQVNLNFIFF